MFAAKTPGPFLNDKLVAFPLKPPDMNVFKSYASFIRENIVFFKQIDQNCEHQS